MNWRFILTIMYGLFMFWTGLLRSIEAQAFKPNAFWFCLVVGCLALIGGFLFRSNKRWIAVVVSTLAAATALTFYLYCFVTQPEKDASIRVALAIIASIAQLCVVATAIFNPTDSRLRYKHEAQASESRSPKRRTSPSVEPVS